MRRVKFVCFANQEKREKKRECSPLAHAVAPIPGCTERWQWAGGDCYSMRQQGKARGSRTGNAAGQSTRQQGSTPKFGIADRAVCAAQAASRRGCTWGTRPWTCRRQTARAQRVSESPLASTPTMSWPPHHQVAHFTLQLCLPQVCKPLLNQCVEPGMHLRDKLGGWHCYQAQQLVAQGSDVASAFCGIYVASLGGSISITSMVLQPFHAVCEQCCILLNVTRSMRYVLFLQIRSSCPVWTTLSPSSKHSGSSNNERTANGIPWILEHSAEQAARPGHQCRNARSHLLCQDLAIIRARCDLYEIVLCQM